MDHFRLKRYNIQALPKALRRQLAPRPGHIEPGLPSKTKLVRVRVDRACLWSACKSTSLAIVLILIGATMAVIGFYAPALSSRDLVIGNSTVTTVDAAMHWHLKNLTYVGPAFMGLGCVIIVAICVMTFEARDKAAKICPEDPLKPVKDDLYVNVIKNIVRKYSALPKVSVQFNESNLPYEDTKLLPSPPGAQPEINTPPGHLLEKPVDSPLGVRSLSEPCFPQSFLADARTQLPLVQIAPLGGTARSPPESAAAVVVEAGAPAVPPFKANNSAASDSSSAVSVSQHPVGTSLAFTASISNLSLHNLRRGSLLTTYGISPQRPAVAGETVADVHPFPQMYSHLPLRSDSPAGF
ncbi:uncharacterized protein LOC129594306 [Paramacrobiotus metropolitanus]|uniref:uncharacterized protein LOC129594306 n=1 Tax=Paramacrobiotus metropolitanus TaxID=2943436 RepID=UPI002445FB4A|nr:uncharacterized protein LOC129594306 [Paramacrobiotus metropolitanus]